MSYLESGFNFHRTALNNSPYTPDPTEIQEQESNCRNLWAAVLMLAISDLKPSRHSETCGVKRPRKNWDFVMAKHDSRTAREWFRSGDYLDVVHALGIDPDSFDRYLEREVGHIGLCCQLELI